MNTLFNIYKLNSQEAENIATSPGAPHTHDFEELLVGVDGAIEHFIDYNSGEFHSPFISFITKNKVHRIKPVLKDGQCNVWVIQFRSEFIPETTFHLYSYYNNSSNLQMLKGECFNRMVSLCDMMFYEITQNIPDFLVIKHLLSTLFAMIESEKKRKGIAGGGINKTQNITFKNFLKIVEENFRRPEGVEFYAEKLFMSARNLNLVCRQILQLSVSEIIETRKLIEAKNLLIYTDKTISEIGFELGYNEKAYFTNVFKKKSGQTPSDFRKEMSKLIT